MATAAQNACLQRATFSSLAKVATASSSRISPLPTTTFGTSLSRGRCLVLRSSGKRHLARLGPRASSSATVGSSIAAEEEGPQYVSAEQAKALVDVEGYKILDVRDYSQYNRGRIPTAMHIPFFVNNDDLDPGTLVNRALHNGFAGFLYGIPFLKQNPEFVSAVQSKLPKDAKILLVCQQGMRSGAAANLLADSGYKNLAIISAGLNSTQPGMFPSEGPRELKDAGNGGLVSVQGPVSAVIALLLATAWLFIQFFPTQAYDWFGWTA